MADRPSARPGAATRAGWRRSQTILAPLLFLAPALISFSIFVLYPIAQSIRLSFYDWDGIGEMTWIGLGNYRELLADPVFYTALSNNLKWLALYLVAPALGLGLAIFLNQAVFGIRLARALFFLPFVLSQVVVGLIFGWFFNAQLGLFNQLLSWTGMGPAAPLESERWAIFVVILAGLWPHTAYCMILYLTALASLAYETVAVARLDGAGGLRLFWHVVLPQLRPASFIVVMVSAVSALRSFDLVMIMTLGGPYNSSTVLGYYMYEQAFLGFRFGYGAAVAVVQFIMMWLFVGYFLRRMLRQEAR